MVPVLYQYFTSRTMEEEMKLYTLERVNLVRSLMLFLISIVCSAFVKMEFGYA